MMKELLMVMIDHQQRRHEKTGSKVGWNDNLVMDEAFAMRLCNDFGLFGYGNVSILYCILDGVYCLIRE